MELTQKQSQKLSMTAAMLQSLELCSCRCVSLPPVFRTLLFPIRFWR